MDKFIIAATVGIVGLGIGFIIRQFENKKGVRNQNVFNNINYNNIVVVNTDNDNIVAVNTDDDKYCCYMNSMIQALASSDVIINQFVTLKKENKISSKLLNEFIDILQSVNNNNLKVANNTKKLKDLIKKIDWRKIGEKDAYEFLCVLINGIHDEIRMQLDNKQIQMPMSISLLHKFKGINVENKIQTNFGLIINFTQDNGINKLDDLIKKTLSPIVIDGNTDQTLQISIYATAPKVLLLNIQDKKDIREIDKLHKKKPSIIYEDILKLDLELEAGKKKEIIYQLCAVITSSHQRYLTYRKYKNKWYLVKGENVKEVKFDRNEFPHLLIYETLGN